MTKPVQKSSPPLERLWVRADHRPSAPRRHTAPAATHAERDHLAYFTFPSLQPRQKTTFERIKDAANEGVEDVEAGCFRMLVRIAAWYMWRKWR